MSQVGVHGTLRDRYGLGAESTPIVIIVIVALCFMTDGDLRLVIIAVIVIPIVVPIAVVPIVVVPIVVVVVVLIVVMVVIVPLEIARVIVAGECGHTQTRYQAGRDHQLRYTES